MNQGTTLINAEELFGNFSDPGEFQDCRDGFEVKWEWPEEIGNGFISMIKLRPGLMLGIGDFRLIEDIAVSFEQKYHSVAFGFGVSGSMRCTVNSEEGQKGFWGYKPGHSVMGYQPEWQQGIVKYSVGTQVCYVGIWIDSLLLNTFMDGQHNHIPIGMRDIVNGAEEQYYYQTSIMTPSVNMAIQQILDCPYRSPLKRLYLESKALELITHSMAQFIAPEAALKKNSVLRPQDIERVHHAKKLVGRDFQNPPKLLDLAKAVGLPHPKLNFFFRELYGTTVFGYLREMRLNKAKSLLDEGRMNVAEVAYAVGYSSLSHFAKSFKYYHGAAPGNYLREVSHRW
jgi:AraC-like DNA-binding protein